MTPPCRFAYLSEYCDERRLVVRDVGPWDQYATVTGTAQQVVAWLTDAGELPPGRRLFYYDSDGALAELGHHAGRLTFISPPPWPGVSVVAGLPLRLELPREAPDATQRDAQPGPATHPPGCSCGSPECPEWQAAHDDGRLGARQAAQLHTEIMGAPAAGAVPRWQTMGQLADQLDQWAAELKYELDNLDALPPFAARASRLVFGARAETELRSCASCVRRYLRAVADETAAPGS